MKINNSLRAALAAFAIALAAALPAPAQRVVVLHTNDTHSQITPLPASQGGLGGIVRRKALVDSVRAAEPNVLLVDAGDAVQGSVFFTVYKGEAEQRLMDSLRYDIQIVGNHEFDNGIEALARQYATTPATLLSTNYDFSATPLAGRFAPYAIKQFGDKKIAFIAGNLNPSGMIDDENWQGLVWHPTIEALNAAAWWMKNIEKADKVIALTHIGYTDDSGDDDLELAAASRNIDAIIGGHSHTFVDPSTPAGKVLNLDGDTVIVAQARNKGQWVGELVIDFDNGGTISGSMLPVDARYDNAPSAAALEAVIEPYQKGVDEVASTVIASSPRVWRQDSPELLNLLSDWVKLRGEQLTGKPVDMALLNKGGIRTGLPSGKVTKGDVMSMLPFNNGVEVIEIKGSDLLETLAVNAGQGGQGTSQGVEVTWLADNPAASVQASINGKPILPDQTYTLATITYLSKGGDYMTPLKQGVSLAKSPGVLFADIIADLQSGRLKLKKADTAPRMHPRQ